MKPLNKQNIIKILQNNEFRKAFILYWFLESDTEMNRAYLEAHINELNINSIEPNLSKIEYLAETYNEIYDDPIQEIVDHEMFIGDLIIDCKTVPSLTLGEFLNKFRIEYNIDIFNLKRSSK